MALVPEPKPKPKPKPKLIGGHRACGGYCLTLTLTLSLSLALALTLPLALALLLPPTPNPTPPPTPTPNQVRRLLSHAAARLAYSLNPTDLTNPTLRGTRPPYILCIYKKNV